MTRPEDHEPEVLSIRRSRNPERGRVYFARCRCGWVGPDRSTLTGADQDASAHLYAELPGDAPGSVYR